MFTVTGSVVILTKKTDISWVKNYYTRFFFRSYKFVLLHIRLPRCVYFSGVDNYVIFNIWVSAGWVPRLCAVLTGTAGALIPATDWQDICHSCANNFVLIGRCAPSPLNGR